ncbi:phosphatase PAP2 family protein [Paenibacillus sp. GCM10023248]|uniref:phosphatase PAP2 family protein n=1 Tax=Bacillales TaxID=1385 RepID=UPI0023797361|nr:MULTISPECIES: phosphatase PAP2 family protein [Bacillales]MDD9268025.1 phosphatase PAP2 family protein [Paenibacillus sp. MAHUQ-63]MDR6879698.1 undecaprenyl-diphosphatase [Bacillus sp. 3255]
MTAPKLKVTFVLLLSMAALVCFIAVSSQIHSEQLQFFDHAVIQAVQSLESPELTPMMAFFSFIGSTWMVITLSLAAIAFLYFALHHRFELLFFVLVETASAILNQLLKLSFARERPDLHRIVEEAGFSFPSGHSMGAFALYASLAFLLWRHISSGIGRIAVILLSSLMILLIGISRIYLGVHYPSDVIGGYLASGACFTLAVWLFQWYREYRAYPALLQEKTSKP